MKDIYIQIYEVVRLIPKGRISTYGAIAKSIGLASGARMVGYALSQSFVNGHNVPAHRVVNRLGLLTGKMHFSNANEMQRLLEEEGVKVKKDKVINFNTLFWDPIEEIGIKD